MKNIIENTVIERSGIYYLEGHTSFEYSDGDGAEQYILNSIESASDVSSNSRELERYIKDWPSLYHLSRERSLAYRSLDISPSMKILEVGSGCGSITRLLGERAASVVAIEGSPRRAAITKARTRDIDSVKILCASFEQLSFKEKFDVVICNGAFEYAALFITDCDPHRHMLKLLSNVLKPNGSLIIAIENKFGLRYFSSGKEEHTNIMFDGLEGYSRKYNSIRTFGIKELNDLIKCEFPFIEMLLPLPDYKLPMAIIRTKLLDSANCAELFANAARYDFDTCVLPRMHERLVWYEVQNNGLMREFANSFFVIAGNENTQLLKDSWLGDIYSIKRIPELTVKTQLFVNKHETIQTMKSYLESTSFNNVHESFSHEIGSSRWLNGVSIHTEIVRALQCEESLSIEQRLREPVLCWWKTVRETSLANGLLSGTVLDYNWQNSLVNQGHVEFIDKEWRWRDSIEPAWLIYRVVAEFARREIYYVHRWNKTCRNLSEFEMAKVVSAIVGESFTKKHLSLAVEMEKEFQLYVTGTYLDKKEMIKLARKSFRWRQKRYLFLRRRKRFLHGVFRRISMQQWCERIKKCVKPRTG